jgi:hypothetical protein
MLGVLLIDVRPGEQDAGAFFFDGRRSASFVASRASVTSC